MVKENVHWSWRTVAKIFIGLFIVSVLVILGLYSSAKSSSESSDSCWKSSNEIYDKYELKCEQGTYRQCIVNDRYTLTYDGIQQTATVCNKIDGVYAQCVSKGASCFSCPTGSYSGCKDSSGTWVSPVY